MASLNDILNGDLSVIMGPLWKGTKWIGIRAGVGIALGIACIGYDRFISDPEPDKITNVFEIESDGSKYTVVEQGEVRTPFIQEGDKYTNVIDKINTKYDRAEKKASELGEVK